MSESKTAPALKVNRPFPYWLIGGMIVFALFLRAVRFEYVGWDDSQFIYDNPLVWKPGTESLKQCFTAKVQGYYAPVLWLTFRLQHRLWGFNAHGYHAVNVILHSINAVLLCLLCRRIGLTGKAAFAGVLLWAVHPLRVESVAWITELKDVLSLFFCLLSALAYFRMKKRLKAGPRLDLVSALMTPEYWLCSLSFLAAMATKPTVCPWPVLIALVDAFLEVYGLRTPAKASADGPEQPNEATTKESPKRLLPVFVNRLAVLILPLVIAAALALLMLNTQKEVGVIAHKHLGNPLVACFSLAFHLFKMLVPTKLCSLYMLDEPVKFSKAPYVFGVVVTLVFVALTVYAWRSTPWLSCAMLFYMVGMLPMMQIIPTARHVADRYTYIPAIALSIVAGCALVGLSGRKKEQEEAGMEPGGLVVPLVVVAALGIGTWQRLPVWRDPLTLWSDVKLWQPDHSFVMSNHGSALVFQGRFGDGIKELAASIQRDRSRPKPYVDLALALACVGQEPQAARVIHAMSVACANKKLAPADHIGNAARMCLQLGMPRQSAGLAGALLRRQDLSARTRSYMVLLLADSLRRAGEGAKATELMKNFVGSNLDSEVAWLYFGRAATQAGDFALAEHAYTQWGELVKRPDGVAAWKAQIAIARGQPDEAVAICRSALGKYPDNAHLYAVLAMAQLDGAASADSLGRKGALQRDALESARRAADLKPRVREFDLVLARALIVTGKAGDAYWVMDRHGFTAILSDPEMCYYFSRVLYATGRRQRAQSYLEASIIRAAPGSKWLEEARNTPWRPRRRPMPEATDAAAPTAPDESRIPPATVPGDEASAPE